MKKAAVLLGAFLGVLSVSFAAEESAKENEKEGKLTLHKNFSLNKKVEARYLYADIEVDSSAMLRSIGELNDVDRKSLTTTLNSLVEEARGGKICKGGSYSITPIRDYREDSKGRILGQDVRFSLHCKFLQNEIQDYNALLSKINQIVSQNRLLALPQPAVTHRITSDEIAFAKEELFGEFLGELKKVEEKYSTLLGKTCAASELSSNEGFVPTPRVFAMDRGVKMARALNAATDTAAPIVQEDEVHINVNVKLVCR